MKILCTHVTQFHSYHQKSGDFGFQSGGGVEIDFPDIQDSLDSDLLRLSDFEFVLTQWNSTETQEEKIKRI